MNSRDQLIGSLEATHGALVKGFLLAGDSGAKVGRSGYDYILLCQRLTQLLSFCERNPKLPTSHLFTLYLACWSHVRAHPRSKPEGSMQRAVRGILMSKLVDYLCAGGKMISHTKVAELTGISRKAVYDHYPAPQHLFLAVMDEMIGGKG